MFSKLYQRYVLATLAAVYLLNLVDRGLIMLLLEPIKRDLALSDTQLGFLTGIAFALFYATLGLPLARWSDRGNRATIASLAIGLWGLTVMASLWVTSYRQLVLARVAAAVGESGCTPPTYSLVGDYFPSPAERTRAMSVYTLGSPLSAIFSFVLGGWLNQLYGWRLTFFLMGIPGLVLALLVKLTIIEPRARMRPVKNRLPTVPSLRSVLLTLWRTRSCRNLSFALILLYTLSSGLNPWYAAFLMRSHGMSNAAAGRWLGLIIAGGGVAGILLGGFVSNRWFNDDERGQMRMSGVAIGALVPCFVAFLTLPDVHQALIALVPLMAGLAFFFAPTYALMQRLVPDEMRATTLAVMMLFANLIGMGAGPLLVGILSDSLASFGQDALRYAMLSMSCLALWSGFHFWHAGTTVREDLARVIDADSPQRNPAAHYVTATGLLND